MTTAAAENIQHILRIDQKGQLHELPIAAVFPQAFGGPCLAYLTNLRGETVSTQVTPELQAVTKPDGSLVLYYSLLSRHMNTSFIPSQTAQPNLQA